MASIDEIKGTLDSLGSGGIIPKVPAKDLVKNQFKSMYPDLTEEELNLMAEDAVKNNGFIVSYAQSNFNMLSSMATSFVQSATIAVSNVAAIIGVASSGFAAPASAPMMVSLKSQAEALKSQGAMLLSLALGAGVELPDSVLTAIKSLDKIPG